MGPELFTYPKFPPPAKTNHRPAAMTPLLQQMLGMKNNKNIEGGWKLSPASAELRWTPGLNHPSDPTS